jgi:CubicO group peptidase (beta-lactamase class C family)
VQVYMGQDAAGVRLAPLEREITLRDLFTFTSGFGYGMDPHDPFDALYRSVDLMGSANLDVLIQRLTKLPLASQPGRTWRYSVGIDVLGYLVQLVSGMPFDAFLEQRLFQPLGMVDTGFTVPSSKQERFAALYGAAQDGTLKRASPLVFPFLSGGGGLVSTATDYWRFAQMLLNGGALDGVRILSPKTVALMTMNHLPADMLPFVPPAWSFRTGYGMGLGVRVVVDVAETQALGSVGSFTWQGAASTDFWVDPQEELVGIFMPQLLPDDKRMYQQFRVLVYQALTD